MLESLKSLPDDPDDLKGLVTMMGEEIKSLTLKVEDLQGQLAAHRKARFGAKSESLDQLAFDLQEDTEIAQAAQAQHYGAGPDDDAAQSETPGKRQHSRAPLPDHLERQTEVLSPGDACASCGGALRPLGEDVTQELEYIPGRFVIRQIVCPRMACNCCETFAQAPLPSRPIERGRAGPGLLAHVLVGKYCDHLPLYRQSEIYAREKLDLHRSTLTDWVGRSTALLEPLAEHIGKLVRAGLAVFADDTPVKMQIRAKTGKAHTAALELCSRRAAMVRTGTALRRVSVQCGPEGRTSVYPSIGLQGHSSCRRLPRIQWPVR
jgi:transposase